VATRSAGVVDGEALLYTDYWKDSTAEVDATFIMNGDNYL